MAPPFFSSFDLQLFNLSHFSESGPFLGLGRTAEITREASYEAEADLGAWVRIPAKQGLNNFYFLALPGPGS